MSSDDSRPSSPLSGLDFGPLTLALQPGQGSQQPTGTRGTWSTWSPSEEAVLRQKFVELGAKLCERLLPGRTAQQIRVKAARMGLSRAGLGRAASPFYRVWSDSELAILRAHFPSKGAAGCKPLLVARSAAQIRAKASYLGIALAGAGDGLSEARWTAAFTPQIDEAIRAGYAKVGIQPGYRVAHLAAALNLSEASVRLRARTLGLRAKGSPDWSATEVAVLLEHPEKSHSAIARMLAAAGFRRSDRSVKAVRLRLKIKPQPDPDLPTQEELAQIFGVAATTIGRWVSRHGLPAERSGNTVRIRRADIRHWVARNPTLIDLRKVDGVSFIDLLVGPYQQREAGQTRRRS